MEVVERINVYEASEGLFVYDTSKSEMISSIPSHVLDIVITDEPSELHNLLSHVNYNSSILIYDKYRALSEDEQNLLSKRGYMLNGIGYVDGVLVYEYKKLNGKTNIELLEMKYDIVSFCIMFTANIDFESVVYCDVLDLRDILFYSLVQKKHVLFPIPIQNVGELCIYLDTKTEQSKENARAKNGQYEFNF